MNKRHFIRIISATLVLIGLAGCSFLNNDNKSGGPVNLESIPTKRELRGSFFEKRELMVIYAAKDSLINKKYTALLKELSEQEQTSSWRSVKINYKDAIDVSEQDLKNNVIFLVGTLNENKVLNQFIKSTPFTINTDKIGIGQNQFSIANALLSVGFYPNPLNRKIPFTFLTGMNAQHVYEAFKKRVISNGTSFYRQNLDYEISSKGRRLVMGDLNAFWKTDDTTTLFDFSKGNEVWATTKEYTFVGHNVPISLNNKEDLIKEMTTSLSAVKEFVDAEEDMPNINIHFYRNMEEKGLMTYNTNQAHADTLENTVHIIKNEIYANNDIGYQNSLVINSKLGSSGKDILTYGFPVYFSKSWQAKGYLYWAARLKESGNTLSLKQLFNNEFMSFESNLIRDCLAGTLVNFLIKSTGKDTFIENYKKFKFTKKEIAKLEVQWQTFLRGLTKEFPKERKVIKKLDYLKGFNFAHEGYSIYNGYGSSMATASLQKQKNLGSNAMAIVPYSNIADVNTPSPFRFSNSAGSENDESVVHATFTAQKMGMYTLLKPQIFVRGSWPGDVEMLNEKDWIQFFNDYYRWIRHYAFLAEVYGIDGLCLGVEFTKASLSHPEEWRKIIQKTRGLFSGHLTYSANWGEEFEQLEFWDDLDYIGLNSYYPLSKKDNPTDGELTAKFDTIKTKIKKVYDIFKKPIVFTEIGFRSVDHPWKNPHAEADDTINEIAQQRCYEVIFEGIQNEPWCQGILWWKYPSYLEYRGEENNAFTPNNKLAEETVNEWFLKL